MSSKIDLINKPNEQFINFVANNIVNEFRSSPGMNVESLIHILSIKFSINPVAGAFAHSVQQYRESHPEERRYDGRSRTPVRDDRYRYDDRPQNQWNDRGRSFVRDDHRGNYDPFTIRPKTHGNHHEQTRTREPSVGRDQRSSTPGRGGRKYDDDDTKSVVSTKSTKVKKASQQPTSEVKKPNNDGIKAYINEVVGSIMEKYPTLTTQQATSEARRTYSFLSDYQKQKYIRDELEFVKTAAASKTIDREGFKMFSNDIYPFVRESGILEPNKIKFEINKRWKTLTQSERDEYAARQKAHDNNVKAIINAHVMSNEWPELPIPGKLFDELKFLRPGNIVMSSFTYSSAVKPQLSIQLINLQYFIKADLLIGIPNHVDRLVVNNVERDSYRTLDELIRAVIELTGIDIRKNSSIMNSDIRIEWSKFLKSNDVNKFGYTPVQVVNVVASASSQGAMSPPVAPSNNVFSQSPSSPSSSFGQVQRAASPTQSTFGQAPMSSSLPTFGQSDIGSL